MPERIKKSGAQEVDLELAGRRFFLLLLVDRRERRAGLPDLEGLDLDLALRRRPASAALGLALVGDLLGWKPDARTGDGIVDQAPADLRLLGFAAAARRARSSVLRTPVSLNLRSCWNVLMAAVVLSLTSPLTRPL